MCYKSGDVKSHCQMPERVAVWWLAYAHWHEFNSKPLVTPFYQNKRMLPIIPFNVFPYKSLNYYDIE